MAHEILSLIHDHNVKPFITRFQRQLPIERVKCVKQAPRHVDWSSCGPKVGRNDGSQNGVAQALVERPGFYAQASVGHAHLVCKPLPQKPVETNQQDPVS